MNKTFPMYCLEEASSIAAIWCNNLECRQNESMLLLQMDGSKIYTIKMIELTLDINLIRKNLCKLSSTMYKVQ
jgi:hypothetical protein